MHTREEKLAAFGRLLDIQERLRKECPWDRKQTYDSLRPNTIEEVYELCDALINDDTENIYKELGDVMEHVVLYSIMGEESGDFDVADVCNHQADKLMFRHPFINWKQQPPKTQSADQKPDWTVTDPNLTINQNGQVVYKEEVEPGKSAADKAEADVTISQDLKDGKGKASDVEITWEQIKQKEKDGNKTVLGGVPKSLPSLIKAYRIQDKARNVGFDWKHKEDVWEKVREELGELEVELNKGDQKRSTREMGDFIFSIINAARLYRINPDNALEYTNRKFMARFGYIEQKAKERGKAIKEMTLEEMDKYWNEAKTKGL